MKFWNKFMVLPREIKFTVPVIVLLSILCWVNLEHYPVISGWDEGIYLQFSRNLAQHHVYGSSDLDHFHRLVPAGGTGPILIGLVAIVFHLFGVQLILARSVIAVFLILSLIGFYFLIKDLTRWGVALASVLVFLVAGYRTYDTLWMGRQFLAEIPALAFLFWGLFLFQRSLSNSTPWLLGSGIFFLGMAVITKNQLIWIVPPGLGVLFLLDLIYFKQGKWIAFLLAMLFSSGAYLLWNIGARIITAQDYDYYNLTQRALFSATYLNLSFSKLVENVKLLIASGFWLPMVFAVCYGFYSIRSKEIYSLKKGLVYILSIISLFSATVSSLPWARYIYLPIVLILPVVAIFVNDHIPWMVSRRYRPGWYMAVLAVVVFGLFTGYKFAQDIRLIITTHDHSAQEFSLEIQKIIPVEEPVYNWEWEIDFYANLNFAHPEYQLFPAMLDETYNHRDSAPLHEKRIPAGVHYVIVGPFATQTNLFKDELDQMNSSVLYQKGAYLLYYIH